MSFLRRMFSGSERRSRLGWPDDQDGRWAKVLEGYEPAVQALALEDPEPELRRLLGRADEMEADYMRRSDRGRLDVNYSDRLTGATYSEAVDVARATRALDDQALAGVIEARVSDLRSPYPIAREHAACDLMIALAERARRRREALRAVPPTWSAAVYALESEARTPDAHDDTDRAAATRSSRASGAATPTNADVASTSVPVGRAPITGGMPPSWIDPGQARLRFQALAEHLGLSEEELLARLFSTTDEPWAAFRRDGPTAHPELPAWLAEIDAIPDEVLDAWARVFPRDGGRLALDGTELRRRLRAFVLQSDEPALPVRRNA